VTEFFDFLKTRIAAARKYAPAARDYALFRTLYHVGLRYEEDALRTSRTSHGGRPVLTDPARFEGAPSVA
jgi:integrase/recombinase XerD